MRERKGGEIKRRGSRYECLSTCFYSPWSCHRGFMCLFISPLSLDTPRTCIERQREYASARGWPTVSGPCRLEVAFSFNPFVPASRSFFSATRFATTGPKKSFPRNLCHGSTDVNPSGSSECPSNCGHCFENRVTRCHLTGVQTDGGLIVLERLRQCAEIMIERTNQRSSVNLLPTVLPLPR